MRLWGKNFQSWPEFDLKVEGLTVLWGDSNLGKSAIFRACKGLFRNDIPSDRVRNGQEQALEIGADVDKVSIRASRTRKGSVKYIIDEKEYAKLGSNVPLELSKLGFGEVRIGDCVLDPIFAVQNGGQFLLEISPSSLNTVLGAFSATEKLEAGKKEANLQISHINGAAKTLALEIGESEERSQRLVTLQKASSDIAEQIHELESTIRILDGQLGWLRTLISNKSKLADIASTLDKAKLPDVTVLARDKQSVDAYLKAAEATRWCNFLAKTQKAMGAVTVRWDALASLHKQRQSLVLVQQLKSSQANTAGTQLVLMEQRIKQKLEQEKSLFKCLGSLQEAAISKAGLVKTQEDLKKIVSELSGAVDLEKELSRLLLTCPKCGFRFK